MADGSAIFSVWIIASVLFVLAVVGVRFIYGARARKKAEQNKDKDK